MEHGDTRHWHDGHRQQVEYHVTLSRRAGMADAARGGSVLPLAE